VAGEQLQYQSRSTIMAAAESSKAAARNGVKANPNTVGPSYELPWCAESPLPRILPSSLTVA